MDKTLYESAKLESMESGQLSEMLDRVTDLKQEIIYHRSAWMATRQGNGSFSENLTKFYRDVGLGKLEPVI